VVAALSADSWELITEAVVAPEQVSAVAKACAKLLSNT